jgi:autotransporter-associated beta strand protein
MIAVPAQRSATRRSGLSLLHAAIFLAATPAVCPAGLTDAQFFAELDLNRPGLEQVRSAVEAGNLGTAKAALGAYYRARTGTYSSVDALNPAASVSNPAQMLSDSASLVNRTGAWDASLWSGNTFNWAGASMSQKGRMYFFSTFGAAAAVEEGDAVAQQLVYLIRSFAAQYPDAPTSRQGGGMWASMDVGIRMRSGWPEAFLYLLNSSPAFTDEDIVTFLKSIWEQTDYLYKYPSETSNWLTFEMAGLYTSGVVFPEFADATEWRRQATRTVHDDIPRGWLPDGVTVEKSLSYGAFFSNYLNMHRLAQMVGRLGEFASNGHDLASLPGKTAHMHDAYLKVMSPDRATPVLNDGGSAAVPGILTRGLEYFPGRNDWRWIASNGSAGSPPAFSSVALPYAGYLVLRSGWERDANYLLFDAGGVGYRHAHQDKLHVVLWAYGRRMLFDSSQSTAGGTDAAFENYYRDTYSHSTGLVDDRPQRRKWYNNPHPNMMPYEPVPDFSYEINADGTAWASGVFDYDYGLVGSRSNDSYPYSSGSNFNTGWSKPASHYRQIAQAAPDLFVVQDWFVSKDGKSHAYEVRWQIDSANVGVAGHRAASRDQGQPNLLVLALDEANNLVTEAVQARLTSTEIMGWNNTEGTPRLATTLRHRKSGSNPRRFVTVLHPLRAGASSLGLTAEKLDNGSFRLRTSDGRRFLVRPSADNTSRLVVTADGIDSLPVAAQSSVAVSEVATSGGVRHADITVTVCDGNGNVRSGGGDKVFLSATGGYLGPVADLGDGTYRATVGSSIGGSSTVAAYLVTDQGGELIGTRDVEFLPPAVPPVRYTYRAGTADAQWNTPALWEPQGVPADHDHVIGFRAGAGTPNLLLNANKTIRDISYDQTGSDLSTVSIRPNASVTLNVGGKLSVDYDGGRLEISPNTSASSVILQTGGNIDVRRGTLDLGRSGQSNALVAVNQNRAATTVIASAMNLNITEDSIAQFGHLQLPASGTLNVNTGPFAGTTAVSGLWGSGGINAARSGILRLDPPAGTLASFSGWVDDGGPTVLTLEKTGAGTQILAGDLAHQGGTTVLAGTLLVNGDHSQARPFTVAPGASLGGWGAIGGDLLVPAGATLLPGGHFTAGTFKGAGAIEVAGTARFRVFGPGVHDKVAAATVTRLSGTVAVELPARYLPQPGDVFDFVDGALEGSPSFNLPPLPPTLRWETADFSGTGRISVSGTSPPPNQPPVVSDRSYTVPGGKPVTLRLAATDDDGDTVSYSVATGPQHGTISDFDPGTGILTYTPQPGFAGTDSFVFSATDLWLASTATIQLTVTPSAPAPSIAHSSLTAGAVTVGPDGLPGAEITVTVRDAQGQVRSGLDQVHLRATDGTLGSITNLTDGTYRARLTSTNGGMPKVSAYIVTDQGGDLIGSAHVTFAPAPSARSLTAVTGSSATAWTNPSTWSPAGPPGAGDHVAGFTGAGGSLTFNTSPTLGSLMFATNGSSLATAQIRAVGTRTLTVSGDLTVDHPGSTLQFLPNNATQNMTVNVGGDLDVRAGTLKFGSGNTTGLFALAQNAAAATTVAGSLEINLTNNATALLGHLVLRSGGAVVLNTGNTNTAPNTLVSGLFGYAGTVRAADQAGRAATLSVSNASGFCAAFAGDLAAGSGSLALVKTGAGTQVLAGTNSFAGGTSLQHGALLINGALSGPLTVAAGTTLGGLGEIIGPVIVPADATLAAGGLQEPGTFRATGQILVQGRVRLRLFGSGVSDRVTSPVETRLDGTLSVILQDGYAPQAGDVFDLIDGKLAGSPVLELPVLPSSLAWDTTHFAATGSIGIIAATTAPDPFAEWLAAHPGLSGPEAYGEADPDGDGMNNHAEFAFGGDPLAPTASVFSLAPETGGRLTLEFVRRRGANAGAAYVIEHSADLASGWQPYTPAGMTVHTGDVADPIHYERVRITVPPANRGFYRIRATIAP